AVYGQNATLQADGWTGENHHHMIACMITLYTVKVHDASAERKTADNLLRLLEEVFRKVQDEWGGVVVAIVTDASGESRKARRDFVKKYPWVIVLDCYAHQYTDSATDLIAWLRGKTLLLALIREEQLKTSGITSAIIRAVLTRWTTHLRAYERLLSLRNVLRSVALTDSNRPESQIIIGDRAAKTKAKKMLELIDNGVFWQSLARFVRHLRPLGVAVNVIQSSFCRVDTVLLTFGHLVATYLDMNDPEDRPGCQAIINSIERRWSKADQEIFIAAVILNPVYQTSPFALIPQLRLAEVVAMMTRLWRRFLKTDPPDTFAFDLLEYLGKRGDYANLDVMCNIEKNRADRNKTIPEPMNIFQTFLYAGKPDPPLILFARRLLSVSANSASCERLFSIFGATLTKLRNRLGVPLLTKLTELKMHIRDEHIRDKTAKMRLKRRFEPPKGPGASAGFNNPTTAPTAPPAPSVVVTPTTPVVNPGIPPPSISIQAPDVVDPTLIPQAAQTHSSSGFRALVEQEITAVELDDLDNDPLFDEQSDLTTYPLIPISRLFDFSNKHWAAILTTHAKHTFEEELALYELLDLDAAGEDD
ncbi:ribonuclease H-like domain-containing protein, partial [Flammula alnicola]